MPAFFPLSWQGDVSRPFPFRLQEPGSAVAREDIEASFSPGRLSVSLPSFPTQAAALAVGQQGRCCWCRLQTSKWMLSTFTVKNVINDFYLR